MVEYGQPLGSRPQESQFEIRWSQVNKKDLARSEVLGGEGLVVVTAGSVMPLFSP